MKLFKNLQPGDKILGADNQILTVCQPYAKAKGAGKDAVIRGYITVWHRDSFGRASYTESHPDTQVFQPSDMELAEYNPYDDTEPHHFNGD